MYTQQIFQFGSFLPRTKQGFCIQFYNYRETARQGGLRGWQNFSGVPGQRRPARKTITLAEIKAID
jgi:hypothetical protein